MANAGLKVVHECVKELEYQYHLDTPKDKPSTLIVYDKDKDGDTYQINISVVSKLYILMVASFVPTELNSIVKDYAMNLIRRSTDKLGVSYGIAKKDNGDETFIVVADMYLENQGKEINKGVFIQRLNAIRALMNPRRDDMSKFFGQ